MRHAYIRRATERRTSSIGRQSRDLIEAGGVDVLFVLDEGDAIVGAVETRQPGRDQLAYWSGGLTPVYLEGALARAKKPVIVQTRVVVEEPVSHAPAERVVVDRTTGEKVRRS